MKVAILAGGMGTRISEETELKPKPMIEIGGKPILWHIMKIYAHYGFNEFMIALGYKGDIIKEYFHHLCLHDSSEIIFSSELKYTNTKKDSWEVTLLETGKYTQIAGRVRRLLEYAKEPIMLTYGDGVANIDINKLLEFHKSHGRLVTITAVKPPSKFGRIKLDSHSDFLVSTFDEKPVSGEITGEFINGGFMVIEPDVLEIMEFNDDDVFEKVQLPALARKRELAAYIHDGFWACMDTRREMLHLNELWETGKAEWKVWND